MGVVVLMAAGCDLLGRVSQLGSALLLLGRSIQSTLGWPWTFGVWRLLLTGGAYADAGGHFLLVAAQLPPPSQLLAPDPVVRCGWVWVWKVRDTKNAEPRRSLRAGAR